MIGSSRYALPATASRKRRGWPGAAKAKSNECGQCAATWTARKEKARARRA